MTPRAFTQKTYKTGSDAEQLVAAAGEENPAAISMDVPSLRVPGLSMRP